MSAVRHSCIDSQLPQITHRAMVFMLALAKTLQLDAATIGHIQDS